jgi:hypothetical protein
MNLLFKSLNALAIGGSTALLCVPLLIQAAAPHPAGSVYNQDHYSFYQPGQTVSEDSSFVALPLKGVRMKDLQGADDGRMFIDPVLSYPQDRNWLVFSVKIEPILDRNQPTTFKVFRYSLSTGQLQRIYRESIPNWERQYSLTGFDGHKLIIANAPYDMSPGPCANLWAANSGFSYVYLDMRSPWTGLKKFDIPSALVKQGNDDSVRCENEMEIGDISQYCTKNVKAVAACGMYVKTVSSLPTGNISLTLVEDKSVLTCGMDPASHSAECKSILKVCKPQYECPR